MSLRDGSRGEEPYLSIAERLRREVGAEVDPKVELTDTARAGDGAGASNPPNPPNSSSTTGGILSRLGSRGPAATRYRALGEIARGGMGAILEVFDEDLRRKLAMKVVLQRDGSASGSHAGLEPAQLSRFLEEAQVTGQLDHPGIVPVHELGIDRAGQVYFTMRLVRGRNLEAICELVPDEREGWTLPRATGVLLKVCEAMTYAHAKGVVHRDLKPANVMVGEFGEVYVMDWGLARVRGQAERHELQSVREPRAQVELVATDRHDSSRSGASSHLNTLDGDIVGTPAYMSPEQARGRLSAIGEASDVYAVGAMLYRLLAGIGPYTLWDGRNSPAEIVQRLWAGPPPRVELLAPRAPAELVAICEKAMAREIADRYPNMHALAEDLRAFLEGRVVGAFETGAMAEARKWVRRNKALAASLAAAVVVLIAGLATSIALGRRAASNATLAEKRRGDAEASSLEAGRQARVAEEVARFLNEDIFSQIAPERAGRDVTVRTLLDLASLQLNGRFNDEPEVEAALRKTIGASYSRLGAYDLAHGHLERAVELARELDSLETELYPRALIELGNVEEALNHSERAVELYREALDEARRMYGAEHPAALTAMNDMGISLQRLRRTDEARALYEQLLEIQGRVYGEDHADTLTTLNNLAVLELQQGDAAEMSSRFEALLARQRSVLGERSPATIDVMGSWSTALLTAGRFEEAEAAAREALDLALDVLGPEHPDTAVLRGTLATIAMKRGRSSEARQLFTEALEAMRGHFDDDHSATLAARHNVATLDLEFGRAAEALEEGRDILALRRSALPAGHPLLFESMNLVAGSLHALKRLDEAQAQFRELVDAMREAEMGDQPLAIIARENLAGVLYSQGKYDESEEMVREVLAARERVLGLEHPDVTKTHFNLGMVLKSKGDNAGAREQFEAVLERMRAGETANAVIHADALRYLGDVQLAQKEYDAALRAYREALELLRAQGPDNASVAYVLHQLGATLRSIGDRENAVEVAQEAFELRESLLGSDDNATRVSLVMLAVTLLDLERFDEAEERALELHESSLRAAGASDAVTLRARKLLVDIYTAMGRPDDAEKWR